MTGVQRLAGKYPLGARKQEKCLLDHPQIQKKPDLPYWHTARVEMIVAASNTDK